MVIHYNKHTTTYSEILNEEVEKKLNRVKVFKKYTSYMNNFETSFDKNSSSYTGSINPYYEDYIKKKKSNNIYMLESIKLEDADIVQDLYDIFNDGGLMVRILDASLYINMEKYSKHDRVLVKVDKEEYTGSVTCVDSDDVVIKSSDGKRNRIKIEDIKNGKYKITRNNK